MSILRWLFLSLYTIYPDPLPFFSVLKPQTEHLDPGLPDPWMRKLYNFGYWYEITDITRNSYSAILYAAMTLMRKQLISQADLQDVMVSLSVSDHIGQVEQ